MASRTAVLDKRAIQSDGLTNRFVLTSFLRDTRRGRQLQDGCNLTGVQPGQEDDLAFGKLKRVVMPVRVIRIHLPKLSNFFGDLLALVKEVEWAFILHVFLEREFRPWKQTNCDS
jgi:hypothetical protein